MKLGKKVHLNSRFDIIAATEDDIKELEKLIKSDLDDRQFRTQVGYGRKRIHAYGSLTKGMNIVLDKIPHISTRAADEEVESYKCYANEDWDDPKRMVILHEDRRSAFSCLRQILGNVDNAIIIDTKHKINDDKNDKEQTSDSIRSGD